MVNCWIGAELDFHYTLQSFRAGEDMSTKSLEAKLLQQLQSIREEVLYKVFLNPRKSYGALYREQCMEILVGIGIKPWMCYKL